MLKKVKSGKRRNAAGASGSSGRGGAGGSGGGGMDCGVPSVGGVDTQTTSAGSRTAGNPDDDTSHEDDAFL